MKNPVNYWGDNDAVYLEGLQRDAADIREFVCRTPIIRLPWLDTKDRNVWAKLECNQLTNSFKIRGAFNAIRKLHPDQRIYTASAGNHGLAVAHAAHALGRRCIVFVPVNASELKLRRLLQHGASVEPVGRDLHEAAVVAKAQAFAAGGAFISPFSNDDVIRGQASVAIEVVENFAEPIDTVIAPLGGGGLIAGIAPVLKAHRAETRLIGVHPEAFQRSLSSASGAAFIKAVRPTLADGLAVQHDECDIGLEARVRAALDRIELASEAEIERAVVALLHNESVLSEGAGAISLVPLLRDLDGKCIRGNVIVIVSGGNIASASVMKCFMTRTDDARVAALLGQQSTTLVGESARKGIRAAMSASTEMESMPYDIFDIWTTLLERLSLAFVTLRDELREFVEYVEHQGLDGNDQVTRHVDETIMHAIDRLDAARRALKSEPERRSIYRLLIQEYSFLRNCLSWCSASNDQSRCVMFFHPQENASASVNYDRYGSAALRKREVELLQSLGFDPAENDLLLVSSGQAAYGVIESFLLSEVLTANVGIVMAPYVYFEALEQIERLDHVRLCRAKSWQPEALIDLVEREHARVLFMDPLANLGTMNVIDLRDFAELLAGRDWSDKWIVVDSTMVSGGINVFAVFDRPNHPNVLCYESGSKYLQLGLDLQMAGVVICRKENFDRLAIARRNTGAVMYQTSVCRFPHYDRKIFLSRMAVLTRNAEILVARLTASESLREQIDTAYPRNWRDLGWAHGGGVVAIRLCEPGLNNYACLEALIQRMLENCRRANVPLTKGVSFGFAITRVSAAAAMADNMPPFLRFSVGEETQGEMSALSDVIAETIAEFVLLGAALQTLED